MKRLLLLLAVLTLVATMPVPTTPELSGQEKRPLTLEDYFLLESAGSPTISPDGEWVVFSRSRVLRAENRSRSDQWLLEGG